MAIVLSGLRYGCDRPLLQGTAALFEQADCDVARLAFDYAEDEAFLDAPGAEQFARIAADGRDIVAHLSAMRPYEGVWLIGNSLGTLSMGAALSAGLCAPERAREIWLTQACSVRRYCLGCTTGREGDWRCWEPRIPPTARNCAKPSGDSLGWPCTWWRERSWL